MNHGPPRTQRTPQGLESVFPVGGGRLSDGPVTTTGFEAGLKASLFIFLTSGGPNLFSFSCILALNSHSAARSTSQW